MCVISIPLVDHACLHMYMASSHTDVHTHITSPLIYSLLGDGMSTLTFYALTTYTWAHLCGLERYIDVHV